MLDHNLTLKSNELFLVGEIATDGSGERAAGLYLRDTRFLSRFSVTLNGEQFERLSGSIYAATRATVTAGNPPLGLAGGEVLAPHTVSIVESITIDSALRVTFRLRSYERRAVALTLDLDLGADFRDLFEIRGFERSARGVYRQPRIDASAITFGYVGRDGKTVETRIEFDRSPSIGIREVTGPGEAPSVAASFQVELVPGTEWSLETTISPSELDDAPDVPVANTFDHDAGSRTVVVTDSPFFNRLHDRAVADLDMLQTSFPEGALPAAGIPWYIAPFGRDSLIVGLQTLHLAPARAAGTLRVLAALQGRTVDRSREEEPGKILHEMRYGEMARAGEIPHTPYYGTVDATPLFVMLFAETVAWTADNVLYQDLLPHVRRAMDWIEQHGDLDGDGLIEYRTDNADGGRLANQSWKDSHDSLNHADGSPVSGPIAPVEVQGYVYSAYQRLAGVVGARDDDWANELRARADAMRRRVEEQFWLEPEGFYAQALDGAKAPVRAISSNPGHLLFCGLPSAERAAEVTARFLRSDLDSGWGLRTLSANAVTYNPMSYHNGSVWPHDNSLIAAGFFRYGQIKAGDRVLTALYDAGRTDALGRLPELYCGFERAAEGADASVAYPVSCSPQAWAAGSLPLLVRSALGLEVDVATRRLRVKPALPTWLNQVTIRNLSVFGEQVSIQVERVGDGYKIDADGTVELDSAG